MHIYYTFFLHLKITAFSTVNQKIASATKHFLMSSLSAHVWELFRLSFFEKSMNDLETQF